jgi:Flp pilus assembly protein TadG
VLAKSPVVRRLRGLAAEGGQAIVLVVISLVVLLGMAAFVIDIGYVYYTHRSLQASADAAALAGAQELPDPTRAAQVAAEYTAVDGAKNARGDVNGVTTTITTKCLTSIPGCDPVNAVVVVEKAPTKTFFAGVLGINAFNIKATSTACSPCGVKPIDLMLVLDRTGSMCQFSNGSSDPGCTDLNNAKEGMRTLLGFLDSKTQWAGLTVLPPARRVSERCNTPDDANYNRTDAAYTIVGLSDDFTKDSKLNTSSNLVATINCQKGSDRTAYANALEAAQKELETNGRPDVKNVIVFLSDGAANIGPTYYPTSSPYRQRPCWQGTQSAAAIKQKGTLIYSIGYDLNALNGGANKCTQYDGDPESPAITAYQAIQAIASSPNAFFNKPSAGELKTIFTEIAVDLQRGTSALIDNDTP